MSPRRRHRDNEKLPPYVYLKKGRYVLEVYDKGTKKRTESRLCAGTATLSEIWQAYEAKTKDRTGSFQWLSGKYQKSSDFKRLSRNTQRDYEGAHRRVCAMKLKGDLSLGEIPLRAWTPGLVQKFLDKRGDQAPVTANREKAYISRVFSWGAARDYVTANPAKSVSRIPEHARTRYVTDAEYATALEHAAESGSPYLVPIIELAYLLRARLAEVLDLRRENCQPDGLLLKRRKGSKDSFNDWTPRLRDAVIAAKALHGNILSQYLVPGYDRGRMRESTVQSAWQRLKKHHGIDWNIHDLKAKGVTDTSENKLAASGHRDPRMLAVYDRLPGRVKPTR